ncbi:MAG: hypothetical protein ACFE0Q_14640 [Anaerolineae bacterium]
MTVRPTNPSDMPLLAEYWYDQIALYTQKHQHAQLLPDALIRWQAYAQQLLSGDAIFLTIERDGDVFGCIIGRIINNQVGLAPLQIGCVEHIVLDLHSPHKRQYAVHDLLEALMLQFRARDIMRVIVRVPAYAPVEQAFWRGLGWAHLEDTFGMDLV